MGKEIVEIAVARGHEIVSIIDVDTRQDFASEAFRSADVAIEFTAPSVAYGNCLEAFKNGVKVVSGSTGWMGEHGEEMRRLCAEEGKTLFWSSNFSLGVAIFSAVNKYLAKIMNNFPNYVVSMVETHHIHKLDAPSGTALTLAHSAADARGLDLDKVRVSGRNGNIGERTKDEIAVMALRGGDIVGRHTVGFYNDGEFIELNHTATSRNTFSKGALRAAKWLVNKPVGLYSIADCLEL